jgi:hypothetical protein
MPGTPLMRVKHTVLAPIAAGTATTNLTRGGKHHFIFLACTLAGASVSIANIKTYITNVIVKANGQEKINLSSTDLFMLQSYYGTILGFPPTAGVLVIPLVPYDLESYAERSYFAWGTDLLDSFTLELKLAASVGTYIDTITPFSDVEFMDKPATLGRHICINTLSRSFASYGVEENIADLPTGSGDYRALHIFKGAGYVAADQGAKITSVKVEYDHAVWINDELLVVTEVNALSAQRTPVAGYHHVDFGLKKTIADFVPMPPKFNFSVKPFWGTAGTSPAAPGAYRIIAETIQGVQGS